MNCPVDGRVSRHLPWSNRRGWSDSDDPAAHVGPSCPRVKFSCGLIIIRVSGVRIPPPLFSLRRYLPCEPFSSYGLKFLPFVLGDWGDDALGPKDQGRSRWRAERDLLGPAGMRLACHSLNYDLRIVFFPWMDAGHRISDRLTFTLFCSFVRLH